MWLLLVTSGLPIAPAADPSSVGSVNSVVVSTELKTVKLYGAGGISGLDAYQSGFFISEEGHILTVWSTVLDIDDIVAVSSDGNRYQAQVLGIDPNLEIAVLETDRPATSYFDLRQTRTAEVGERVLALSNLFGIATGNEMSSVQKGVLMAKTELKARRGTIESVYQGPVYIVDAMTNNPGAAGGALTDFRGRLLGMLGKELRDTGSNIWINYAIPMAELQESIDRILAGKSIARNEERPTADRPTSLSALGIVLIPNILAKTPAFVDLVQPGSTADRAGLQSDDLILFVNSTRITSQDALRSELNFIDRADEIVLLIQRNNELKEIVLSN